ncbi:type 2 periplasmic-binding domain-containing protein [Roseateles koreensis]|uniref:Solute-binding protein family 3/N-terminal domain-containing protein n=1 Tax=Roseateles koreensis TaxID=2987526 RepID=A0ABT5KZ68_9BURK|nr:hypothetical protein [Roseateles koreensis]MDC8787027.1 hypothetical protein [Roseateles koreensis]
MAAVLCGGASAWGECSRTIRVPVAPTGFNVLVQHDKVEGVYPELLRRLGSAQHCEFVFPIVPRARLAMMFFETQEADLFVPASRNAERDAKAEFVPMLKLTPALIMLGQRPDLVSDVPALLAKKTWRGAMVRSYSWGDEYEALLRQLQSEKRVDFVSDLRTVGQMLRTGRVDFTILPPTLLYSALSLGADGSLENGNSAPPWGFAREFQFMPLQGLPRSVVGAYLSRQTLSPADQQFLREALTRAAQDGSLLHNLQRYYPPEVLRQDVQIN